MLIMEHFTALMNFLQQQKRFAQVQGGGGEVSPGDTVLDSPADGSTRGEETGPKARSSYASDWVIRLSAYQYVRNLSTTGVPRSMFIAMKQRAI
jgi:hypothetical protein